MSLVLLWAFFLGDLGGVTLAAYVIVREFRRRRAWQAVARWQERAEQELPSYYVLHTLRQPWFQEWSERVARAKHSVEILPAPLPELVPTTETVDVPDEIAVRRASRLAG